MRACSLTICLSATALLCGSAVPSSLRAADEPALPVETLATLKGHTETVYAVAFSPDGRYVLTGSFDKTLKLWEAAAGKEIKSFAGQAGHQNLVLAGTISPDGRLIASGGADNTAKLWDTPLSIPLREYVHGAALNAVALNPDGTRLAGAGKDGTIELWNAADGKPLFRLSGHAGSATSVAFVGNGQFLASGGTDGTVRLWSPANGQALGVIGAHTGAANAVAASPSGNALSSVGEDGLLKSWKLPLAPPRKLAAHGDLVTAMVLSGDGQMVVTASADKNVRLSNFDNGQPIRQWKGPAGQITALAISPNKAMVAAGASEGRLYLWNAADGKPIRDFAAHAGPLAGIAFHSQSTQILTAGQDGALKLWNAVQAKKAGSTDDKPLKTIEAHKGGVTAIAFHSNGAQALTGGADKTVRLWDLTTGKMLRILAPLPDAVTAVAYNRDFTRIGAAVGKLLKIWDVNTSKELLSLAHSAAVTCFSFSADKSKIVTGAADSLVRVWDATTGAELQFFPQSGPVHAVAFHPNNTAIVSAGNEKAPPIDTLAIGRALVASAKPIRGLAALPNSQQVLTAGADGVVKLWNINTGAVEQIFTGAVGPVRAAAVSRNAALFAVGREDKTVHIYSFPDRKLLATLKTPGAVLCLAFNANNQTLAAGCDDKSIVTWDVNYQPGQPLPPEFGRAGQSFNHADGVTGVTFGPDGVLYSTGGDKRARAWKLASNVPIKNFGHGNLVDAVAFDPAGTQLATGGHEGLVRIWDVAKGQILRQINAHTAPPAPAPIYCLAWSPDGKQVISGSFDRSLKLWDAASGALVREFRAYKEKEFEKGHREPVFCVAFSPDGKTIASGASGSSDCTIKLWNVANGAVLRECINPKLHREGVPGAAAASHPGAVYSLRFTADGSRLVSVGHAPRNHGYLAVWQAADAKLVFGEDLDLGNINSVAISPDGKRLAIACSPRGRHLQEANAYVIKMPAVDNRQTTRAGK